MRKEYLEALEWLLAKETIYRGRTQLPISPALRDIKQYLEAIDNAKPSEALKCLRTIAFNTQFIAGMNFGNELRTIKQALIKAQELKSENNALLEENKDLYFELALAEKQYKELIENAKKQEKVLSVIKEKCVDISILEYSETVDDYNNAIVFKFKPSAYESCKLTKEEFDLLKRWLG